MKKHNQNSAFVDWFRQSSPYIHAHRGRVLVLSFAGEAIDDNNFSHLIHDIALLKGLGMQLVLVPGARPQIEQRLTLRNAKMRVVNDLRITDDNALQCVKEAAGAVRVEIEARLSMGLSNSPMAGTSIRVASGNYVTAKPTGVVDGVDFRHTGEVRKVDVKGIKTQLDSGSIALVPPLGYSPTGEVFNLSSADVAAAVASALGADKLVFLTEGRIGGNRAKPISSLLPREVDTLLQRRKTLSTEHRRVLRNAATACRGGVKRTHILNRHIDGVLLSELFTRDGAGTLVMQEPYEQTRTANVDDVGGILELIEPMEQAGILVKRSRELFEQEIDRFHVVERDSSIIACAALYPFHAEGIGELACLAVHQDYRSAGRGDQLLEMIEQEARAGGLHSLFVLSTRTTHWFRERGFQNASVDLLPKDKREIYNWQRNAKVFIKNLQ